MSAVSAVLRRRSGRLAGRPGSRRRWQRTPLPFRRRPQRSSPLGAEGRSSLQRGQKGVVRREAGDRPIREVAQRANVNHGLVHRHFGSKRELIAAAIADRNDALQQQLLDGASPHDLISSANPDTAMLLARLILDDATSLVTDHPATAAVVKRVAEQVDPDDSLTAGHRAAMANAITLGWTVFGPYLLQAAGVQPNPDVASALRTLVDQILEGKPTQDQVDSVGSYSLRSTPTPTAKASE